MKFLTGLVLAILVIFFCGPSVIHAAYRAETPDLVFKDQKKDYVRLATAEPRLIGNAKKESERKRRQLVLWFHSRGVPVNESDEMLPVWQPWSDLIAFWSGNNEGRS